MDYTYYIFLRRHLIRCSKNTPILGEKYCIETQSWEEDRQLSARLLESRMGFSNNEYILITKELAKEYINFYKENKFMKDFESLYAKIWLEVKNQKDLTLG